MGLPGKIYAQNNSTGFPEEIHYKIGIIANQGGVKVIQKYINKRH
jgi:hypothetical protein